MRKLLLIDDSQHHAERFNSLLKADEMVIEWCDSGLEASRVITKGEQEFAAVIIRMEIPGPPFAFELLIQCRQTLPRAPVIVISSALTAMIAGPAFKLGASDVLQIPLDSERVKSCLRALITPPNPYSPLVEELNRRILGKSSALLATLNKTAKVIPHPDARVLLIGESGTGKELVARAIHELGPDQNAPWVAINVSAIPKELIESELFGHEKGAFTSAVQRHIGYLEQAGNGTLFLDEIGDLALPLQVKLLRAIQEKRFRRLTGTADIHFKARLVCATNRDLAVAVASNEGTFRSDLYHRISEVEIRVPPLREREGDADLLIDHFLEQGGHSHKGLAREARTILRSYPFPGNIRELENLIKAALIDCEGGQILPQHLSLERMGAFLAPDAPGQSSSADDAAGPGRPAATDMASTVELTAVAGQARQKLFEELARLLPEHWLDLVYKEATAQYKRAFDRVYLLRLWERHHHKVSRAAKVAGLDRKTFERHWKDAGLPPLREEDESDNE